MKVLIVIPSFTECIGGPMQMITTLSKYYRKAGHEVSIATTNWDCNGIVNIETDIFHEYKDYKIIYFKYIQSKFRLINQFCFSLSMYNFFKKHLREYDVVHTHSVFLFPTFAAAYWAHQHKVPYFITPHGILQKELLSKNGFIKRLYSNMIEKRNLKYAAGVHCLTQYEQQSLQDQGFTTKHAFVIPNGIDCSVYDDIYNDYFTTHFPEHEGKKKIVFLSRINWKKGLDTLIPAIAVLVQTTPNIHLFLAGPDNENYLAEINELIADYNVSEFITYVGVLKGKTKYSFLKSADVFVLPSYSEGFSMAVLESLAAGTPVVITPHCNFDAVQSYNAGIIAEKNDSDLSSAIIQVIANQAQMSNNAFHLVNTHYQWNALATMMTKKYTHVKKDNHV